MWKEKRVVLKQDAALQRIRGRIQTNVHGWQEGGTQLQIITSINVCLGKLLNEETLIQWGTE